MRLSRPILTKRTYLPAYLLIAVLLVLSACSSATPATPTPVPPTTAPAANAAASSDVASEIAAADAGKSPCIGVQPAANENIPTDASSKKWTAPEVVTFGNKLYCAILTTKNGRIVAELFPKIAPKNVNNFVFLAKQGYYENITFHRVIAGFMAQSGDPTGTGGGGPGYDNIPLETNPAIKYDREGRVGVARTSDPNSAGSQFFITFVPQPNLDAQPGSDGYTIIGQVVEGMNTVRQIAIRDVDKTPNLPTGDALISVRIVELPVTK
ncbi:MAG: peptidylprolyl isomerase [Chloroflexota bacterium]